MTTCDINNVRSESVAENERRKNHRSQFYVPFKMTDTAQGALMTKDSARFPLREKCPSKEFFLVRIFLYLEWIWRFTDQKKLCFWILFTQCFDPQGDGNCQLAAVTSALQQFGIMGTAMEIRMEVVEYLNWNSVAPGRMHLELFTSVLWLTYFQRMSRFSAYGDEITLRTISNRYGVELRIVSTLVQHAVVDITDTLYGYSFGRTDYYWWFWWRK